MKVIIPNLKHNKASKLVPPKNHSWLNRAKLVLPKPLIATENSIQVIVKNKFHQETRNFSTIRPKSIDQQALDTWMQKKLQLNGHTSTRNTMKVNTNKDTHTFEPPTLTASIRDNNRRQPLSASQNKPQIPCKH